MNQKNNSAKIKFIGYSMILAFILVIFELASYVIFASDIESISKHVYFEPSKTREEFNTYLDQREPDLGWPTKTQLMEIHESDGSRKSPANRLAVNGVRFLDAESASLRCPLNSLIGRMSTAERRA